MTNLHLGQCVLKNARNVTDLMLLNSQRHISYKLQNATQMYGMCQNPRHLADFFFNF